MWFASAGHQRHHIAVDVQKDLRNKLVVQERYVDGLNWVLVAVLYYYISITYFGLSQVSAMSSSFVLYLACTFPLCLEEHMGSFCTSICNDYQWQGVKACCDISAWSRLIDRFSPLVRVVGFLLHRTNSYTAFRTYAYCFHTIRYYTPNDSHFHYVVALDRLWARTAH